MTDRDWVLRDEGARPLTINKVATMNRFTWAKHTENTRGRWHYLAREARIPHLDACRILVVPLHANGSTSQDVASCAPAAKAAVDGLVDAGVLDDDDPTRVRLVTFLPPLVCGVNGLELTITEVPW